MSDFKSIEQVVYNQAIDENSTTQNAPLGTIIKAIDKDSTDYGIGEFIYLQGVASTAVGSCVLFKQDDFSTSLATANDVGYLAFAMAATVANEYGWYQIRGRAVSKAAASCADDASMYLTSTAGTLDDAVVAGDRIKGYCESASAVDTPSTGLIELDIVNPFVDNGEAA